jgi:hypothetical protein
MIITRNTMRGDGQTVGQALDKDAAFLRSLGFKVEDGANTIDEQREDFKDECRNAVLDALDAMTLARFKKADKGWIDEDLRAIFKTIDDQSELIFNRNFLTPVK